jgi:sugar phosphate isomerase/epimerase
VRGKGMRLAYHNHDFELVDFDGRTGLELLFAAAGPDLQTELDLAWVARAGLDPAVMLGKFRGHVFAVHAKDNAPKGQAEDEGGFAAVGQGVLDWNAILPAAAAAGVHGTSSSTTSHAIRPRSSRPARTICVNT